MSPQQILFSLILLVGFETTVSSAGRPLPLRVNFVSPNGQYSVQLEEINGDPHFVIADKEKSEVSNSIEMPTRLLYLHWAADSRSFVTVEHIAHGSRGRIIYLRNNRWTNVEVEPPFEGKAYYSVISLRLGVDTVHYRFVVTPLTNSWERLEDRLCDFDVNLNTGKFSKVRWTQVTDVAGLANLMQNPLYLPPMDYNGPWER